jgi:hypothetical protein
LGVVMGATHFNDYIRQLDRQLYYRHRVQAEQSHVRGPQIHQPSADHIATRYVALARKERELVCSILLDDYLATTTGDNPHLAAVVAAQ